MGAHKKKRTTEKYKNKPKKNIETEVNSDGSVNLTKKTDGSRCEKCGYLSSNKICKACVLLAGLEMNRPKVNIENNTAVEGSAKVMKTLEQLSF